MQICPWLAVTSLQLEYNIYHPSLALGSRCLFIHHAFPECHCGILSKGSARECYSRRRPGIQSLNKSLASPIYISATVSIQVFYCSIRTASPNSFHSFLMNVPDIASYCPLNTINVQEGFRNFALRVVNTSETGNFTLDTRPLVDVEWIQVPGTEFSWGRQVLVAFISHTVTCWMSPFGLVTFDFTNTISYMALVSCGKSESWFLNFIDS